MSLRSVLISGAAVFAFSLPSLAVAQSLGITIQDLNLRAGPSTGYGVVAVMPAGASLSIHQCSGGWCQVTYAGASGWASQRYLDMTVAVAPVPAPSPGWVAGPPIGFEFHSGLLPPDYWDDDWDTYWGARWDDWDPPGWYAGWQDPNWWDDRPVGWYGPVYWDRSRWWHSGDWYSSPGFALHIGVGG